MNKTKRAIILILCMMFVIAFVSPVVTFASTLDDISNDSSSSSNQGSSSDSSGSSNGAISDYLNDYTPITEENMSQASSFSSPIANALGTLAGGIIIVVEAAIVVVTALDLCYIGLPFTRTILNPNYGAAAQGGGGMGMGMGGGFGGGYGRMGGMGGMGGGQAAPQTGLRRQWVSDEAVQAVQNAQPQQGGSGMSMGGMGMGMGMGGMGMGGQQQQQPQNTKSVIWAYFKSRTVFIIIFTIAAIILTSSLLTHSGINLAALLDKIIGKGNNMIYNAAQ